MTTIRTTTILLTYESFKPDSLFTQSTVIYGGERDGAEDVSWSKVNGSVRDKVFLFVLGVSDL